MKNLFDQIKGEKGSHKFEAKLQNSNKLDKLEKFFLSSCDQWRFYMDTRMIKFLNLDQFSKAQIFFYLIGPTLQFWTFF